MRTIITIFKKEFVDSIRDRRTLMAMIVVPILLYPLLISLSSSMMISQARKAQSKTLRIALISNGNAESFRETLLDREDIRVVEGTSLDEAVELVRVDTLDAVLVVSNNFDKSVEDLDAGGVTLYHKSTESTEIEVRRVRRMIEDFGEELREARFAKLDLNVSIIETIDIDDENLASAKERIAEEVGGILPYLIIIFCFMGCMYPAIDLAAGEKERGTLETLLTSPAGRLEILLGKFGVVVLTGIVTAAVSILGMYLGIRMSREIPPEILQVILNMLEWDSIALTLSLLLPLTAFFAAFLLSISIFSKSFKEAQSVISPLFVVIIIPAFIGLMPGMTLNAKTALIPILNVSLATKAIIAGTVSPIILAEVYLSLIALALVSLWACAWFFGRESTIFRGT
jgi:sodium transport system permease protein